MPPRSALDVHADHACGQSRADVVVHAVSHVRDPSRLDPDQVDQSCEELRRGLRDPPAGRRAEDGHVRAQHLLGLERRVADRRDEQAGDAQPVEAGERVGVEVGRLPRRGGVVDLEDLPDVVVMVAAGREAAQHAHQRERRHSGDGGSALPHAGLVDERLADVEDNGLYSHAATRSRSAGLVTLSSRSSPGTTVTRPPAASTSEAQSVARSVESARAAASAARRTGATNAWGVCTATSSSRLSVSSTTPARTRLTVSLTGRPGTAPSKPCASPATSRSRTSSATSGRAASCTRITPASAGPSPPPARTEPVRVAPPVTHALTLDAPTSSASRIVGSS